MNESPVEDADDALAPGEILGPYRIEERLGAGGMGAVYAAYHIDLRRQVALKVIARRHSTDERMIERFRREARMASQARHPNIVDVLDLGQHDGRWYLAMERLLGIDLHEAIALQGRYEPSELMPVLDPVLSGLACAHGLGLVHRDLKPANIFLARVADDAVVKLLDFGVVKVPDEGAQAHLTRTGTVVGTPAFMAPEQATGGAVDARADLYALGCVAYAMLAGAPPFVDRAVVKVLTLQVIAPPVPPSRMRPGLPHAVDAFVLKALAKRPEDRYQSAEEMRGALKDLARALGDSSAAQRRITLPPESITLNAGLRSTEPAGASGADLARTIRERTEPTPARSALSVRSDPPAASAAPLVPPAQPRASMRGIVVAAVVGALIATVLTYLLTRP